MVERYGRPAFLIAFDGDIGKGSGRSISRFDLHAALLACGDLLERYGGHQMAAGLTIRRDRLDEFRERFGDIARETLGPDDLGPEQRVDLELGPARGTRELERMCRHLEPCGAGNASPVFGVRGVRFVGRCAGRQRPPQGHAGRRHHAGSGAIGFQWADRVPWLGDGLVDAAFRLESQRVERPRDAAGAAVRAVAARGVTPRGRRVSARQAGVTRAIDAVSARPLACSAARLCASSPASSAAGGWPCRRTPACGPPPTGCARRG